MSNDRANYRAAVFNVAPFEVLSDDGAFEPNGNWSQSEADWPGSFIEQSRDAESALVASCATIGMAATHPVRLNDTSGMSSRRGFMTKGPF